MERPHPVAKYNKYIYINGYFHGGSNINLNLIACEDTSYFH